MIKLKSSRKFIILVAIGLIVLHVLIAVYLIVIKTKINVIEQEGKELSAVTNLLKVYIQEEIPRILTPAFQSANNTDQIQILKNELSPVVESLAATHPDQAVGFYSTRLNAFICYAPEEKYHKFIGVALGEKNTSGNLYLSSDPQVVIGSNFEGKTIISREPVKIKQETIGYVFAYKNFHIIEQGLNPVAQKGVSLVLVGFLEAILLLYLWDLIYIKRLKKLKLEVYQLSKDLSYQLPAFRGELGEIASLINELAKSLIQSRTFSDQLMESLPIAVVVMSTNKHNIIYNPAASKILRIKEPPDTISPQDPIYLLQQTLCTGKTIDNFEFNITEKENTRNLLVKTDLIKNESKKIQAALLIAWDVTEYRLMEAQLRKTEKLSLISELAAGTAHEIRNPLTSIRGLVQILSSQFKKDSPEQKHFKVILQDIDRINLIIKELYLLATPIKPKLQFTKITDIIEENLVSMKDKLVFNNIKVEKFYTPEIPKINLDREQMKKVFANIIKNALEAMPNGGLLDIQVKFDVKTQIIKIVIADDGEGILSENIERVFDPFYTTRDDGIGLGLTVCYQIIKNHNGKLLLDSKWDKGSKFTILLPTQTHEEPTPKIPPKAPAARDNSSFCREDINIT